MREEKLQEILKAVSDIDLQVAVMIELNEEIIKGLKEEREKFANVCKNFFEP